jgi:predicted transcriptional regulator YheO
MQRLARSITATKTTQHNSKDLVMREKLPGILHRQMRSCRWSIRNAKITSILCMNM